MVTISHGHMMQTRCDGKGSLPTLRGPTFVGMPALEITHPSHLEMFLAILLGSSCNHDLGILLRLPSSIASEGGDADGDQSAHVRATLAAMGAHAYYCANYASKDQPHIDGLLVTLADGLQSKELDIVAAREAGEDIGAHEHARQNLRRLLSSINRRMHKGFPEMLTCLLRKPLEYSSHAFGFVGFVFDCLRVCF